MKAELEAAVATASAALKSFPRGPTGLTPDHIKFSPEYRAAKQAFNEAFSQLRAYNAIQNRAAKARNR